MTTVNLVLLATVCVAVALQGADIPTVTPVAVQPATTVIVRGNEVFASVSADISDIRKAFKEGTKNEKGVVVQMTEAEFKLAVARRVVEQATSSYNAMLQSDAELEKRGKELRDRIEQDILKAKNSRPNIVIEK